MAALLSELSENEIEEWEKVAKNGETPGGRPGPD
jgi:hypothetical protein